VSLCSTFTAGKLIANFVAACLLTAQNDDEEFLVECQFFGEEKREHLSVVTLWTRWTQWTSMYDMHRALILTLIGVFLCGCVRPRATVSSAAIVLGETFDAGPFTIRLARGMKRTEARGIDSYAAEFESDNVVLRFDYGQYPTDFPNSSPEITVEEIVIDGRTAKIGTGGQGLQWGNRFPLVTGVAFQNFFDHGGAAHFSIFASCRTQYDVEVAKEIFKSVRFISADRPPNLNRNH
jgi:hypothetical protein